MLKKPDIYQVKRLTAVATTPAMQIQYNGSALYGGAIASSGDLTLYADNTDGATTAVATLDLTTPAAADNTWGKVRNTINALSGWRCFLIGVKPSDPIDTSIVNITSAAVKAAAGITLLTTSANTTHYRYGLCLTPQEYTAITAGNDLGDVTPRGYRALLTYLTTTCTYASGAATLRVWSINDEANTETLVYDDTPGATTVAKEIKFGLDYNSAVQGKIGDRLLVQVAMTTGVSISAVVMTIAGKIEYVGP